QVYLGRDRLLRVGHEVGERPRAHIGLHLDDAPTFLALDLGRAGLPADIGQVAESYRNAGAVVHAQRPDMVDAVTVLRGEPDADIVALVAVLHGADSASAQRLDEVEHLSRIEPASRDLA